MSFSAYLGAKVVFNYLVSMGDRHGDPGVPYEGPHRPPASQYRVHRPSRSILCGLDEGLILTSWALGSPVYQPSWAPVWDIFPSLGVPCRPLEWVKGMAPTPVDPPMKTTSRGHAVTSPSLAVMFRRFVWRPVLERHGSTRQSVTGPETHELGPASCNHLIPQLGNLICVFLFIFFYFLFHFK